MSKRRKVGDWVWLMPNSGFVGESNRLKAEIQPEDNPPPCFMECGDNKCREWSTLWTEEDSGGERHALCHVGECRMRDEPFRGCQCGGCADGHPIYGCQREATSVRTGQPLCDECAGLEGDD